MKNSLTIALLTALLTLALATGCSESPTPLGVDDTNTDLGTSETALTETGMESFCRLADASAWHPPYRPCRTFDDNPTLCRATPGCAYETCYPSRGGRSRICDDLQNPDAGAPVPE